MIQDPLDRAVRAHYADLAPSPATIERLRRATAATDRGGRRAWRVLAAAAALLVITGMSIAWWTLADRSRLAGRVALEIALNHEKTLDLDFVVHDYDVLGRAMDKLDFALAEPQETPAALALVGGRYCSIQGQLAAQLRLERKDGGRATLYQTKLAPSLAALGARTIERDAVSVRLWSEGDVFFALARDRAATESYPASN